jgi:exodeoxyribonuclease VII large subunit
MLPGPLEDGMLLQVRGAPRLHPLYGFSVNIQTIQPVGEGSIKKAAQLLEAKLAAEGLFDPSRKRSLPYPPRRIGLITSGESAAYRDFIKILNARWGGVEIDLVDVQVQGELAPAQIVAALSHFETSELVDVIVLTRGGGSAEDLATFSTEQVTRAVAGSRIPTLVAIGHEVDISLAELAADQRASTPSNAAELLVPDKKHFLENLQDIRIQLGQLTETGLRDTADLLEEKCLSIQTGWDRLFEDWQQGLAVKRQLLEAFNPQTALRRGYAIVRSAAGKVVRSGKHIKSGEKLKLELADSLIDTAVRKIHLK